MRQERCEHDVEVVDGLRGGEKHGSQALAVLDLPWLGVGDVLVRQADQAHDFADGGVLVLLLQVLADGVEALQRGREQIAVDLPEGAFGHGRDLAEVLEQQVGHAVDEIAPAGDELFVVVSHEFGPGEVGVLLLGAGGGDVVAHRVDLVAGQDVAHVDDDAAGAAELPAFRCHVR